MEITVGIDSRELFNDLPVGSVVEQRRGSRTYLIVQESPGKQSVIESWDDGLDVTNRLLGRLKATVEEISADMSLTNERLAQNIRHTEAKIETNQRLLDELVADRG
jgi:hypothetical protein